MRQQWVIELPQRHPISAEHEEGSYEGEAASKMTTFGWASILLGISGLATGSLAAWYWLKSTRVSTFPNWSLPGMGSNPEPSDEVARQAAITAAMIMGMFESAQLNRKAALYSGATALLSGLSAVAGALSGFI